MQNKVVHAAERKAFQTVLTRLIDKSQTKDAGEIASSLINLVEKIMKGAWKDSSFEMLRSIVDDPDSKWVRYANHIMRDMDPGMVSTFLLNAAYEGGFRGYRTAAEMSEELGINVPWVVLMDPTSACNMH